MTVAPLWNRSALHISRLANCAIISMLFPSPILVFLDARWREVAPVQCNNRRGDPQGPDARA